MFEVSNSTMTTGTIAGVAVGAVALLALIAAVVFFLIRRRRRRQEIEEKKRKAEEDFDPMKKPEMDGQSKLPPGELFAEHKLGSEVDGKNWNEMDASKGSFHDAGKLRAEMEGTSGGAEMEGTRDGTQMEGTKGGFEMQAGEVAAPVELWAGSDGLYELPSLSPGDDGRPSPASRIQSSSGSGRPSPGSASKRRTSARMPFGRKPGPSPSMPRDGNSPASSSLVDTISGPDSGTETWSERPSPRPTPPPQMSSPQFTSPATSRRERARRGDDLTRRLENSSRNQSRTNLPVSSPSPTITAKTENEVENRRRTNESGSHLSVASPTTDIDGGIRRLPNESGADRWNERFGSRTRDHRASPQPPVTRSPGIGSGSQVHRYPSRPLESPRQVFPSPERPIEGDSRSALRKGADPGSWTSRGSDGGGDGGYRSAGSDIRGNGRAPGGFF